MRKSGRLGSRPARASKNQNQAPAAVFAIAFAVVAALSAAVTLGGKSGFSACLNNAKAPPRPPGAPPEPSALTGGANILLYCYESSGDPGCSLRRRARTRIPTAWKCSLDGRRRRFGRPKASYAAPRAAATDRLPLPPKGARANSTVTPGRRAPVQNHCQQFRRAENHY